MTPQNWNATHRSRVEANKIATTVCDVDKVVGLVQKFTNSWWTFFLKKEKNSIILFL